MSLKTIQEVLIEMELAGTPMDGKANAFIDAGKKYNIDPLFLLAIGHKESRYGAAYSKADNDRRHSFAGVMAWDKSGRRYLKEYATWDDAIMDHARILRVEYLDKGLTTVNAIWAKYAPISDNNLSWGPGVKSKYQILLAKCNNIESL